jgi:hypothetical protein
MLRWYACPTLYTQKRWRLRTVCDSSIAMETKPKLYHKEGYSPISVSLAVQQISMVRIGEEPVRVPVEESNSDKEGLYRDAPVMERNSELVLLCMKQSGGIWRKL